MNVFGLYYPIADLCQYEKRLLFLSVLREDLLMQESVTVSFLTRITLSELIGSFPIFIIQLYLERDGITVDYSLLYLVSMSVAMEQTSYWFDYGSGSAIHGSTLDTILARAGQYLTLSQNDDKSWFLSFLIWHKRNCVITSLV